MADAGLRVALLSLEPWDAIWRRNQHLSAQLVRSGAVSRLAFLEPPSLGRRSGRIHEPIRGVRVVPLGMYLPKRVGGLAELGLRLRTGILKGVDVLWVNDPTLGVHCLRKGQPAVYDVTDDWRSYQFPPRILRRIAAAEDVLARRARTVVCSTELQRRWRERYNVNAALIHNGVDPEAWQAARPRSYEGPGPHVGYVGTLQSERLDIELVLEIAEMEKVGRVHLIGPDALDHDARKRLLAHSKVALHPPVPATDVPSWIKGLDLLVSPHRVTPFTLSLDAIKSYEYLISGRPVVATPTSGFQHLDGNGVWIANPDNFGGAVAAALAAPATSGRGRSKFDWASRAEQFARELRFETSAG